jgi:hypothetical protein
LSQSAYVCTYVFNRSVYVCTYVLGHKCLCDIRLESLYDERLVSLALYIVITLMILIKYIIVADQVRQESMGGRTPREGKGDMTYEKGPS